MATNTHTTEWPEGAIARYLTAAGATVDVETTLIIAAGAPYSTLAICRGCMARKDEEYSQYRNYEDRESQAKASQRAACDWAQSHAETCRAMPRPTT